MPNFNTVHLGELIQQQIKAVGMTKAEFGRRIHTSRQNVNTLLRKADISVNQLIKISLVLNYDFFQSLHSTQVEHPEVGPSFPPRTGISLTIHHLNCHEIQELSLLMAAWQKN